MLTRLFARPVLAMLLALLVTSAGLAQDPGSGSVGPDVAPAEAEPFTLTMEQAANPPERELEFEEVSEELPVKLRRPDPKLLEKKYAAIVAVALPSPKEIQPTNLEAYKRTSLLHLHYRPNPSRDESLGAALQHLIEAIPENHRPKQEELAFFQESPLDVDTVASEGSSGKRSRDFYIYAETPEIARRRAATLLKVLDEGLTRPQQVAHMQAREKSLKQLEETEQLLAKESAERDRLQKEAEEVSEFPADLLPSLRVQQLQLEVDLAGTKSRIEACQKLLNEDNKLSNERRGKVFDMKMDAEVDLASFEARQKTIAGFIEQVKRSGSLGSELRQATLRFRVKQDQINTLKRQLPQTEMQIMAYQPLPLVGKIRIQPVKWE